MKKIMLASGENFLQIEFYVNVFAVSLPNCFC